MNKVLYYICRHAVMPDSYYPIPSTLLSKLCNTSLYKTRKEINKLKEQGLVISDRYCKIDEDSNYIINGYTITEKAKETEEYKIACENEQKLLKECFGVE